MSLRITPFIRKVRMKFHRANQLLHRIAGGLARGELRSTSRYCLDVVRDLLGKPPRRKKFARGIDTFDAVHGVDTASPVSVPAMEVTGKNYVYASIYFPIDPAILPTALRTLADLSLETFTFIDLGAGKGRALLLASEFPFRRIIGVEFASDLHRTAQQNIERYRSSTQQCRDISAICRDAAEYELPPEPTVIFMFNPFEWPVMSRVLANIERSLAKHPRELFIIYVDCRDARLVERSAFIQRVAATPDYRIYRCAVTRAAAI